MALTPESKGELSKFTTAAKVVIFNPDRMRAFLPMLDQQDGAIQAVQTVIGAIEQKRPVPADIAPLLGVNVYLLLVDMAKEITGDDPDPQIVKDVVVQILGQMSNAYKGTGQPTEQQAPQGLIGRQIGA